MQRVTLEELKHILYHAFRDHLTMKDIENIIINEEESLNENSGNCHTEFEGKEEGLVRQAQREFMRPSLGSLSESVPAPERAVAWCLLL